jgi:hypothetical protein
VRHQILDNPNQIGKLLVLVGYNHGFLLRLLMQLWL